MSKESVVDLDRPVALLAVRALLTALLTAHSACPPSAASDAD